MNELDAVFEDPSSIVDAVVDLNSSPRSRKAAGKLLASTWKRKDVRKYLWEVQGRGGLGGAWHHALKAAGIKHTLVGPAGLDGTVWLKEKP